MRYKQLKRLFHPLRSLVDKEKIELYKNLPLEKAVSEISKRYSNMGIECFKNGQFDLAKYYYDLSRDDIFINELIMDNILRPLVNALPASCATSHWFEYEWERCCKEFDDWFFKKHLPAVVFQIQESNSQIEKENMNLADSMAYQEYLKTDHWQTVRFAAIKRAGFRCQNCHRKATKKNTLEVHHRVYERLGAELPTDLTVLCHDCHTLFHKNRKVAKRWE